MQQVTSKVFKRKEKERRYRFTGGSFCSVYGCFNRRSKKRSFFSFPTQMDLRQAWIKAIGRENFVPTEFSKVCSDHFKKEDLTKFTKKAPKLKKLAVPKVFDECMERPFPKYSNINRSFNSMAKTRDETDWDFSRFSLVQNLTSDDGGGMDIEYAPVKQEVPSDEETPPAADTTADTSTDSIVKLFPLKELITQLRIKRPAPGVPDLSPSPQVSRLPVITDVRPVIKPEPHNQFSNNNNNSSDDEMDGFVASSFVDCQLECEDEDGPPDSSNVSNIRIENYSSLRDDHPSEDDSELCDRCGSCTRRVDPATGSPSDVPKKKKGRPSCCCSECPTFSNSDGPEKASRGWRKVPVFQAYGEMLGWRLSRLPKCTAQLVQSVIEDLMFNAEDGQYDACTSKEEILKEKQLTSAVKQIGGFNGYDD